MRLNWSNVGRGLGDIGEAVAERKLADESERLNKKMEESTSYSANRGALGNMAMPDQQTAENYASYNNKIAAEDEATFGGGLSSAPKTTVDKRQDYTRADYYADMGRKASGLGMPERGERYMRRSDEVRDRDWQRGRVEKADARAEESHGMQMEKGNIDLARAKDDDASRQRVDAFTQSVAAAHQEAAKKGGTLSWQQIRQMGDEAKLKPAELASSINALAGIDDAGAKYTMGVRSAAFEDAFNRGGLDGVAKLYNENPLFDDGVDMTVQRGDNGTVKLMRGDAELFSGTESESAAYLRSRLRDPMAAAKFNMDVLTHRAKLRETESKTRENEAQASRALAGAAKDRADADVVTRNGGQKPDDLRQNVNAAVKQVLLATGLAKQDPMGNIFMQGDNDKANEQEIGRISAQAEDLVRQGMAPYAAAEQVIQGRATKPASNPNRPPLASFNK